MLKQQSAETALHFHYSRLLALCSPMAVESSTSTLTGYAFSPKDERPLTFYTCPEEAFRRSIRGTARTSLGTDIKAAYSGFSEIMNSTEVGLPLL